MNIQEIRYQKTDEYSFIFICNESQLEAYNKLKKCYKKLSKNYPNSFMPIYNSSKHSYSTIRFKKSEMLTKLNLNPNDVVSLDFKINRAMSGKKTIYCKLLKIELVSLAQPDEELDLDDLDDSE
jgi:hypothetical protein